MLASGHWTAADGLQAPVNSESELKSQQWQCSRAPQNWQAHCGQTRRNDTNQCCAELMLSALIATRILRQSGLPILWLRPHHIRAFICSITAGRWTDEEKLMLRIG